ncbi:MAG: carbohydrate-binding protein [Spirochaetales bacterium]|nr:carbohydrate-binding protein [Spirochaetales bacterium]
MANNKFKIVFIWLVLGALIPLAAQTPGDVNMDSKVNVVDSLLIAQEYVGIHSEYFKAEYADVNGDGAINIVDALLIAQFYVGLIDDFPLQTTPAPTPMAETLLTLEGEDGYCSDGYVESQYPGFSGQGYINTANASGTYLEWQLDASVAGNARITFVYANGSANNRPLELAINGQVKTASIDFISTSTWENWTSIETTVNLISGRNVIRMTSLGSEGAPNLDKIDIRFPGNLATPEPSATPNIIYQSIYIASDSTAQSYNASYAPQQGWGYYLSDYFESNIFVKNHALGGRSSKSFIVEGRLDTIVAEIKSGDYLFVQMGHNDATYTKPERYTEPFTEYKDYLRIYARSAREKGATPVLITPVGRYNYVNNAFKNDFPDYCTAMKQLAQEENAAIIDLMTLSLAYYTQLGPQEALKLFMVSVNGTDYTHFTERGAKEIARIISEAMKKLNLPISGYVIP